MGSGAGQRRGFDIDGLRPMIWPVRTATVQILPARSICRSMVGFSGEGAVSSSGKAFGVAPGDRIVVLDVMQTLRRCRSHETRRRRRSNSNSGRTRLRMSSTETYLPVLVAFRGQQRSVPSDWIAHSSGFHSRSPAKKIEASGYAKLLRWSTSVTTTYHRMTVDGRNFHREAGPKDAPTSCLTGSVFSREFDHTHPLLATRHLVAGFQASVSDALTVVYAYTFDNWPGRSTGCRDNSRSANAFLHDTAGRLACASSWRIGTAASTYHQNANVYEEGLGANGWHCAILGRSKRILKCSAMRSFPRGNRTAST